MLDNLFLRLKLFSKKRNGGNKSVSTQIHLHFVLVILMSWIISKDAETLHNSLNIAHSCTITLYADLSTLVRYSQTEQTTNGRVETGAHNGCSFTCFIWISRSPLMLCDLAFKSNDNLIIFWPSSLHQIFFIMIQFHCLIWALLFNPGSFEVKQHGFILFTLLSNDPWSMAHTPFWAVHFQNKVFKLYKQMLDLYRLFVECLVFLKVQLWF